jgi:phage tail-like protein
VSEQAPELLVPPELAQTFRFRIRLTRSRTGSTLAKPPGLGFSESLRGLKLSQAKPPGRRPAPRLPDQDPGKQEEGDQLGDGAFQECSGLDLEAEPRDYTEGARNDGVIRRVGRVKLQPVVLKRGMFMASVGGYVDTSLWDWLRGMVEGDLPLPRYDGHVEVYNPDWNNRRIVAEWSFDRGLPAKVTGASLNAKTGEIAIEELHIVHEGLRLENKGKVVPS